VFAVSGINDNSKASACKADKKNVEIALETYYAQNKSFPADLATAKTALVPGYLHDWPSDTSIGYTLVAGPPASFTLTAANGGTTC
jgi:general secretion pathway protein G